MIWVSGVLVSSGEGGVYGERILHGYRIWDPYRSKLAALFYAGQGIELEPCHRVLYLGAANGTTVSHVSDYVDTVYAVEFAPKPMQDLLMVAGRRRNIVPIMADASRTEFYAPLVERIDLLYQDVAHPDQAGIALKNAVFLKDGGSMIVMLKTRSIDVRADPVEVLARTCEVFSENGILIERTCWLNPYHQDHAALICTKI